MRPARSLLHRTFVLSFIFSIGLLSFALIRPQHTSAQTNYSTSITLQTASHYRAQEVMIDMSSAFICLMTGIDVIHPDKGCLGLNPVTRRLEPKNTSNQSPQLGGVLGGMSNMIGMLYQKPISTSDSIQYLANSFGIKKTYAQGVGFNRLSPLQQMWVKLRNITFILMLLLFVFIGFGIMLRVKIDPRTVMSIQNQLPKIVITLILITFSFAISGFLVDAMWFTTYAGINILVPDKVECVNPKDTNNPTQIEQRQSEAIKAAANRNLLNNPIAYVNDLFGNDTGCTGFDVLGGNIDGIAGIVGTAASPMAGIVQETVTDTLLNGWGKGDECISGDGWWGKIKSVVTDFGGCVRGVLNWVVDWIAKILIFIILLLAIFIALVRLWFALIRAYVYSIIGVMIAPIYIGAGLIPGSKYGFSAWLRFMLAHLSVFPVTAFFFVIARIVSTIPTYDGSNYGMFLPPFIGNSAVTNHIQAILVVGVLFITPEVLNITRQTFHSEPNKMISGAIVAGFSRGTPAARIATAPIRRQFAFDPSKNRLGFAGYQLNRLRQKPVVRTFFGPGAGSNLPGWMKGWTMGPHGVPIPPSQKS